MARMIKEEADRVKRELASKNNMVDISDNKVKLGSQAESVQNVNLSPQDIELLRRLFPRFSNDINNLSDNTNGGYDIGVGTQNNNNNNLPQPNSLT